MASTKLISGIFLIAALFFIGCNVEQDPLPKWKVKLVRPDGFVHKQYIVSSSGEPSGAPYWGGQIELHSSSGSTGLIAPTGWIWESERVKK